MILVENLSKKYGDVAAVRDVSFAAHDGRVTGFLGPNGAGKSTTMRQIAGLESPDEGRCSIDGTDPAHLPTPATAVGTLLDRQGALPGLRVRDHLRVLAAGARISSERIDDVLDQVGMTPAAHRRVRTLSLGMKQRLGLAVALLGNPQNLVLDEPINGLDAEGVIWVRGLLRTLAAEGRCILLSSHLMSELELCVDDLVIINEGQIVADGPVEQLLTASPTVTVDSNDNARLARALEGAGAVVARHGSVLDVEQLTAPEVGAIAAHHGVELHLLTPQKHRLEDCYLTIVKEARSL